MLLAAALLVGAATPTAHAQPATASLEDCAPLTSERRRALLEEHLFGGSPSGATPLVRRGYVTEYDADHRVPRWTAWHVAPPYRQTPSRKGLWARFRTDRDTLNPVNTRQYTRMRVNEGALHRGHIAPYFIAGGDRNRNGRLAYNPADLVSLDDLEDACTIFEINLMSNIAPQLAQFNGSGGLWFELESHIRELVDADHELYVIAGTIFGPRPSFRGPSGDIGVPDMYFQILITEAGVAPFLFAHRRRIGRAGCAVTETDIDRCIVSIAVIERLSGLDFFRDLDPARELELERAAGLGPWQALWEIEDEVE